jgi:hypothetical protein
LALALAGSGALAACAGSHGTVPSTVTVVPAVPAAAVAPAIAPAAPGTLASVVAAYNAFKAKRSAGNPDWKEAATATLRAWELFNHASALDGRNEAQSPACSDYGAEADYALADDEIRNDYEAGDHTYRGSPDAILGAAQSRGPVRPGLFPADARTAQRYDARLDRIVVTYASPEWVVTAIVRQGTLYDSLWARVFHAEPPQVALFSPVQQALLAQLERSGRQNLEEQADALRKQVKEAWRKRKESALTPTDELMVRRYATALALARAYRLRNDAVTHARARLAYFTQLFGNAKMREYVSLATGPDGQPLSYTNDMYLKVPDDAGD